MGGGVSLPVQPPKLSEEHASIQKAEDAPHYVHSIMATRPIRFAAKGVASEEGCPPDTLTRIFERLAASSKANCQALRVERPVPPLVDKKAPPAMDPSQLTTWTFGEYWKESKQIAAGLVKVGFKSKDCVCIFGFNAPEWHMAAIASLAGGGCFTGIYPTDTPAQVNWKAKLSNSSVAFAENAEAAEKFLATADDLPYLRAIVHWNDDFQAGTAPFKRSDGSEIQLLSWKEAIELGKGCEAEVQERLQAVQPTDCADLIFTSGTTGNPKAVMISHDNIVFESISMLKVMGSSIDTSEKHRLISYLPLSHIAGSLVDIFVPLLLTSVMPANGEGFEVTFARPYDLKAGSLGDRLKMTRPTLFLGVPRVWEKVQERLLAIGKNIKGIKKKVARAAKSKALQYAREQQLGHSGKVPFGYKTAKTVVLDKIKEKLGLDKCQIGMTGAAPIKRETLEYFGSLGININEVYGMSETTGCATLSMPSTFLWGSVGFALPGVQVEVFQVDPNDINKKVLCKPTSDINNPLPENEGEICFRGRIVMLGYMANPALGEEHVAEIDKKNREVIDNEGWLHSGDKGCKNIDGMLRVTGRFKELIIGAGGENIAPVPIEDDIMKNFHGISNIMMIGDQRKFNVAVVTLKAEGATGELPGTDHLDSSVLDVSPGVTTISDASKDPVWIKRVTDAITATNQNGQVCPSNAARIQKFTILPCDFSVLGGELTATLKLKRSVVEGMHAAAIDTLYECKDVYMPYPLQT